MRTLLSFASFIGHDLGLAREMEIKESNDHRDRRNLAIVDDEAYDQRRTKQGAG